MGTLLIELDLIETQDFNFQIVDLVILLWMGSSAHIDHKKKNILVLGKGPIQGLGHTLTAEKLYSINFTVKRKKFCISLHYDGANSYLFVNGTENS